MIAIFRAHFYTRLDGWQNLCLHILSLRIDIVLVSMLRIRFRVDTLKNLFVSTFDATGYALSLSVLKAAD